MLHSTVSHCPWELSCPRLTAGQEREGGLDQGHRRGTGDRQLRTGAAHPQRGTCSGQQPTGGQLRGQGCQGCPLRHGDSRLGHQVVIPWLWIIVVHARRARVQERKDHVVLYNGLLHVLANKMIDHAPGE